MTGVSVPENFDFDEAAQSTNNPDTDGLTASSNTSQQEQKVVRPQVEIQAV
jgi:hypothetical protein